MPTVVAFAGSQLGFVNISTTVRAENLYFVGAIIANSLFLNNHAVNVPEVVKV
jgi:hypothetical protein